jgi:hypothetical protein
MRQAFRYTPFSPWRKEYFAPRPIVSAAPQADPIRRSDDSGRRDREIRRGPAHEKLQIVTFYA